MEGTRWDGGIGERRDVQEGLRELPEAAWLRETFPELRDARFEEDDDPTFEGGTFHAPEQAGDALIVRIASGGPERFASLARTRERGVRAMAEKLGIPFERMDGATIRTFILLHEAGHAMDYVTNFAAEFGDDAPAAWRTNSDAQLAQLPIPDGSPAQLREEIAEAGSFEAWRDAHADDARILAGLGIDSEAALLETQEAAYRALDKERYADDFAARSFSGASGRL